MLPLAMAQSSSGSLTKSQGERAVLKVLFPTDNTLYGITFGTRTKTAEPIKMLLRTMSWLGLRNSVLRGGGKFWWKRDTTGEV